MSYNSGVIMPVISNQPHATHSGNLKLLAQLLSELYSTQSYYHYIVKHYMYFFYNGHCAISNDVSEEETNKMKENLLL